jgi:hypothetical protein
MGLISDSRRQVVACSACSMLPGGRTLTLVLADLVWVVISPFEGGALDSVGVPELCRLWLVANLGLITCVSSERPGETTDWRLPLPPAPAH